MANKDAPRGLVPVGYLNGSPWNGKFNIYYLAAAEDNDIFIGDPVALNGSADASGRFPTVTIGTAGTGNPIVGVAIGFGTTPYIMINQDNLAQRYRPAETAMYVAVVDDPNVIFEIQEVSGGTALAITAVGNNAAFVVGTGNSATGISATELNNATEVATTENLRILRVAPVEGNAIGEHCKWWVLINEHQYKEAAGV
jgi:hypothetical protein